MRFTTAYIGELTKIRTGKLDANAADPDGVYPFFTCAKEPLTINKFAYDCDAILVAGNGDLNVKHYKGKFEAYQRTYIIEVVDESQLDSRYLYFFMSKYVDKLRELSIGGVIKYIKLGMLTDAEIPLPPLSEQKRIAAILDKADAIRRKRQQAIKLADDFLRATFLDMFGDPVTNPKGWKTLPLRDVLERIDSGWSPRCYDREPSEGEWGVLKLGAVTTCSYMERESKALPYDLSPKPELEVQKGDLLFTRKNTYDLVAACALVHSTRPKLLLSDLIFRLRIKDSKTVTPAYLWALLTHAGKRKQIQRIAGGAAGSMPNISKRRLMEQEIEIPDNDLQIKFSLFLYKLIDLKKNLFFKVEEIELLFKSLTQRAFRGEL